MKYKNKRKNKCMIKRLRTHLLHTRRMDYNTYILTLINNPWFSAYEFIISYTALYLTRVRVRTKF